MWDWCINGAHFLLKFFDIILGQPSSQAGEPLIIGQLAALAGCSFMSFTRVERLIMPCDIFRYLVPALKFNWFLCHKLLHSLCWSEPLSVGILFSSVRFDLGLLYFTRLFITGVMDYFLCLRCAHSCWQVFSIYPAISILFSVAFGLKAVWTATSQRDDVGVLLQHWFWGLLHLPVSWADGS